MNVYRISNRLKVFLFLFSVLLIAIFTRLLLVPIIGLPANSHVLGLYNFCCTSLYLKTIAVLVILTGIILGILLLVSVFKRRIVFTSNSIISKSLFSTRKLTFSEIKGYVIKRSMLYVITSSNKKKRIAINLFGLDRSDNLIRNLEMRFTNLDF